MVIAKLKLDSTAFVSVAASYFMTGHGLLGIRFGIKFSCHYATTGVLLPLAAG